MQIEKLWRTRWKRGCAVLLFLGALLVAAPQGQSGAQRQSSGAAPPDPGRTGNDSSATQNPPAPKGLENLDAAGADRRKQIADDSTRLLKLATDLKVEVDKTTKDTLSLAVIRKADEIEKLAHTVKETMKPPIARN